MAEAIEERAAIEEQYRIECEKMIASLGLSKRTWTCLKVHSIDTIDELTKKSVHDVKKMRGMGAKGISEIRHAFTERGLSLVGDNV